jgi:hydrogenase-4 component B
MSPFLYAICIITVSGMGALLTSRWSRLSSLVGCTGAVIGSAFGFIDAAKAIWLGSNLSIQFDWSIPFGSFFIAIDPISAVFLLPVFTLGGIAAIFGHGYLEGYIWRKNLGVVWFFYNMLIVSMTLVIVARNAILFLVAWEIMSVASFFLVIFEHEEKSARRAGWIYLVATHIGTAFLLAFFILLGRQTGTLDLDKVTAMPPAIAGVLFLLAVVGFGTKAGLVPMHFWLPEAHPAAPSHVSAVMSGVMIKTGIYGIIRAITLLGPPPLWWAWVLLGIGVVSGLIGIIFALAQNDIKRLLAYSSVENIGIISLGLGIGLYGTATGSVTLSVLGYAGAILHVLNHSLFKGLLFMAAGSVVHATGLRDINQFGGLYKRMPATGLAFLIGSASICALPPLNGFAGEFLIYLAVITSGLTASSNTLVFTLCTIGTLAAIGGLAAVCFTKAFGIVFLGEPRSEQATGAHEASAGMKFAVLVLAGACIAVGLLAPLIVRFAAYVLIPVTGFSHVQIRAELIKASIIMCYLLAVCGALAVLVLLVALLRKRLLAGRPVAEACTWDCGYARPTSRMQYTGASFVQPFTYLFRSLLKPIEKFSPPRGLFPAKTSLHTETPDVGHRHIAAPLRRAIDWLSASLQWLQTGRLQIYILYIAVTLLILLVWKLS